ncbi:D-lactate dehydrogenase [Commensalibacter papalotli (ex Botero et al. 2024)]|uniref:Quinone-dependent D-lactate dehydrogenase n=1 Tax=Commensalibacter papalotli (ex Botero et al. 2024) TaxID=2972766 RepID=A0ABM9HP93_9PROT|nr:D-lactate dehydrogenase [Commensalibacter papalotli (ex Botero et al. 2024)]CAI3933412.1 FAD/FMN-containing lactate dehydrogenase/glycolate oxidase (GlcD) (PDB:1AHU) [Commensalibacter papalotli (ex Botero et al. 2024)]CAI3942279.1 FAD/FMN-containing lactate dehydrogenase/glycolate oxidase (GlcD) (PDB:1AHU) [Commensalibacter papalotli (ex Botero et al. 2024)]
MFFKNKRPSLPLSLTQQQLVSSLTNIVGARNIITSPNKMGLFCNGFRYGSGRAIAVVQPDTLLKQWYILQACVNANTIVIMQAANTGLTGGSTPDGNDYDRDIVLINTMKMKNIYLINNAEQVVCLPGATLNELEKKLKPYAREPHSVIGSSCIGASVLGGICNNSGGALVQRGPAYTEMSLFAQYTTEGKLELVNHLGIDLGNTPEEILTRLENGQFNASHIQKTDKYCSDHHYKEVVCQVNAPTPARYNANPTHLHEASGCAGKLAIFAVRLDSFAQEKETKVFYIGTNNPDDLTQIRYDLLSQHIIPVSGEYIHKDAYDIAAVYGKDTFLFINFFGTDYIPLLFKLKNRFDYFSKKFKFLPEHLSDKILQFASTLFPQHLPQRMNHYANTYQHHLLLKVGKADIDQVSSYLKKFFQKRSSGQYFECNTDEGRKAFLQRFAVAGAAVRYRAIHHKTVENILALDIALRRNDKEWLETLPSEIESKCMHKLYYGHFFCHVFHQDYVIHKGNDIFALEEEMLKILNDRGAEYPAEHNVGHLYHAKETLRKFYQTLDPCNIFNPGIGKTSKLKYWENMNKFDK